MDFNERDRTLTRPGELDPLRAPTMWAATGFEPSGPHAAAEPVAGLPGSTFDVCHVGVVLRVIVGVQLVVGLVALQGSGGLDDWLQRWVQALAQALPAALLWLVVACGVRRWLQPRRVAVQAMAAVVLGALAGAFGHLQLAVFAVWIGDAGWRLWDWVGPMALGAALGGLTYAWLRSRQGRSLPEQTQARLVELQARIRPHFLFNTLNTAIALVQVDPDRAEAVLEDLAELFRRALASPATRTTLGEEVELARRYLAIEQLRFGERLVVNWQIDGRADQAPVPTLLLQPLVENAVRHGVEADPRGGWLRVQTEAQGGRVTVTITNAIPTGSSGEAARKGHGIALRNVRQRLLLMHDVEASFEAGPRPLTPGSSEACYVVRFSWPFDAEARA